jgi:hypothetical protein
VLAKVLNVRSFLIKGIPKLEDKEIQYLWILSQVEQAFILNWSSDKDLRL